MKVEGVPAFPTATLPRFPVPVTATTGVPTAVPFRTALAGVEPAVASVTVMVAVLAPAVVGLNTTWISQIPSDTSGTTHLLFRIVNWSALAPASAVLNVPDTDPPTLARLKMTASLVEPTATENVPGLGVRLKLAGVTTVGPTSTVLVSVPAEHTILSFLSPGVVALNVNA